MPARNSCPLPPRSESANAICSSSRHRHDLLVALRREEDRRVPESSDRHRDDLRVGARFGLFRGSHALAARGAAQTSFDVEGAKSPSDALIEFVEPSRAGSMSSASPLAAAAQFFRSSSRCRWPHGSAGAGCGSDFPQACLVPVLSLGPALPACSCFSCKRAICT